MFLKTIANEGFLRFGMHLGIPTTRLFVSMAIWIISNLMGRPAALLTSTVMVVDETFTIIL
jgi:hypothetical protein